MAAVNDYERFNRLAKSINHTHGTTGPGAGVVSTEKTNLIARNEDLVEAKYHSIVAFTTDKNLDALMHKFKLDAVASIERALEIAQENHEEMHEGKALSFVIKTDTSHQDVEFLHYNIHNPVRRGMYRYTCLVEVKEK